MRRFASALLTAAMLFSVAAQAMTNLSDYCAANSRSAPINDPSIDASVDGRRLATAANGYTSTWQPCHSGESAALEFHTCGDLQDAQARGKDLLESHGLIGSFLDADTYNNLWKAWGLSARPDNFDQRIVDRYGLQPMPLRSDGTPVPNPYPRPLPSGGLEDPGTTGGSGQLPMGLIQTRDGTVYNGGIGFTCLLCHAGRIGDETDGPGLGSRLGIGNTTFDIEVFSYDLGKAGGVPIPLPYPHSEGRGTINAVSDFEFLMTVRDFDTLDQTPFVKAFPAHPSPGDQDPPAWHNTGSRPRVYMDGGVSSDNTRALMQFLAASINTSTSTDADTPGSGAWIKKQEADFEDIRAFIDSIEPPAFPRAIDQHCDEALGDRICAQRGEEIFHTRNLFGTATPPHGNGSCSSCHGVYSANYTALLPDSRLLGIAGQIVPRDIIQTDPSRVNALAPELRWGWGTLWFAYADNSAKDADPNQRQFNEIWNDYVTAESNGFFYTRNQGQCGWIGVDGYGDVDDTLIGYAAPALRGVWSTAPYFHNGSVPTVYDVLRYGERPTYWRRPLRTPGSGADRGFDVSLNPNVYDFDKLGWKYQALDCDGVPLVQCDPAMPLVPPAAQEALHTPGNEVWLANQSPRPLTQVDVEARKIYDTTRYGRSNGGHWWTNSQTLSEDDVKALIEYLKTL